MEDNKSGHNITFKCSNCMTAISVPSSYAGRSGKCRSCGTPLRIPRVKIRDNNRIPSIKKGCAVKSRPLIQPQVESKGANTKPCPACSKPVDMKMDSCPFCHESLHYKLCPACGESIKINAKKCKHCNEYLDLSVVKEGLFAELSDDNRVTAIQGKISMRPCLGCGMAMPISERKCSYCGYDFHAKRKNNNASSESLGGAGTVSGSIITADMVLGVLALLGAIVVAAGPFMVLVKYFGFAPTLIDNWKGKVIVVTAGVFSMLFMLCLVTKRRWALIDSCCCPVLYEPAEMKKMP